jgi:hypothetical protein
MYIPSSVLALHAAVCDRSSPQYDRQYRMQKRGGEVFRISEVLYTSKSRSWVHLGHVQGCNRVSLLLQALGFTLAAELPM